MRNYVMKGDICFSKTINELCIMENGYLEGMHILLDMLQIMYMF